MFDWHEDIRSSPQLLAVRLQQPPVGYERQHKEKLKKKKSKKNKDEDREEESEENGEREGGKAGPKGGAEAWDREGGDEEEMRRRKEKKARRHDRVRFRVTMISPEWLDDHGRLSQATMNERSVN